MADVADETKISVSRAPQPKQVFTRVDPDGGNLTVTVDSSSQTKEFLIPSTVAFNFAKSFIEFDAEFPAGSASQATHVFTDFLPVERVQVRTGNNATVLADVSYAHIWTKAYRPMVTPASEYMSNEPCRPATTTVTSFGKNCGLQPTGSQKLNIITALGVAEFAAPGTVAADVRASDGPHCQYILNSGEPCGPTTLPQVEVIGDGYNMNTFCRQHLVENAVNTAIQLRYSFKLEDLLPASILANSDWLAFPEGVRIQLQFLPRDKWGFWATLPITNASSAPLTSDITLRNLRMWVATDSNPTTADLVRGRLNNKEGFSIQVPWITINQQATDASSTFSMQSHINKGMGETLRRIVTVITHTTANKNFTANIDNVAGVKITSWQQRLNARAVESDKVYMADANTGGGPTYWLQYKDTLEGSAILNRRFHGINFCIFCNFTDSRQSMNWNKEDHTLDSGHPLDKDILFSVDMDKASTAMNVIQYSVLQKRLKVSHGGVYFSS